MVSVRSFFATALALACLTCCAGPAQAAPNNMVALGTGASANTLYRFSGDSPGTVGAVPVTGLGASTLVGIDYRPATLELIGLGVSGNVTTLFAIDPVSGVATQVGFPATVNSIAGATAFGVSFNPAADRLRVVDNLASDGGGSNVNNFRLNPNNGALAGSDTDLDFFFLPGGNAEAPLVAVAYDRKVAGATKSTLFGIVSGGDRVVLLGGVDAVPSPNGGMLFNIGPLGVNVTNNTGFDIDPATGEAFMAAESAGLSALYRVDLKSGAATGIGQLGDGSVDFTSLTIGPQILPVTPAPPPPPAEPKLEALSVSPKRFAAVGGQKKKATGSTVAPPRGTTVGYTLSGPAAVAFSVERKGVGRIIGGKCRRLTKGNRAKKPCSLWRLEPRSVFAQKGAAGSNSFFFNGRVRAIGKPGSGIRSRSLVLGSYRLVAKLDSTTLTANFQIVPAVPGPPPVR